MPDFIPPANTALGVKRPVTVTARIPGYFERSFLDFPSVEVLEKEIPNILAYYDVYGIDFAPGTPKPTIERILSKLGL